MNISAFFPVYNEEQNIGVVVEAAIKVLSAAADQYEIIVVDDGSRDKTPEVVRDLSRRYPQVKLITHQKNLGYGAALYTGFQNCQYEFIFFSDGDNQFDLKELKNLIPLIGKADLVTGYRKNRQDSFPRKLNAWGWNTLVRLLLNIRVRDIDCAFKLFKKDILKKINIEHLKSQGAMANTECLARLRKIDASIIEVPVHHYPRLYGRSTGANPRVILRAFRELIGLYRELK
jgi:glycosyltransferase involved in cell wall biosynthesis